MKLLKAIVFAALVGSVAIIGCGDDETTNGTGGTGGGTGGTGGGGAAGDPCVGGLCDDPGPKADCQGFISDCEAAAEGGEGGAGGATEPPIPAEQCETLGFAAFCSEGEGGAGGAGGDLGCDVLACETDGDLKAKCEDAVSACLIYCAVDPECQEDECGGLGLLICNVTGA